MSAATLVEAGKLPFFAFVGAFVLYILNRTNNRQPFSLFRAINISVDGTARPIVVVLDMIISSIVGTIVVIPLTSPDTVPQALIAGLGLTGVLSAYAKDG